MCSKPLLDFVSSLGATSTTRNPEIKKFTFDNEKVLYENSVAVFIGEYRWVYISHNYENKTGESDMKKARYHAPVDNFLSQKFSAVHYYYYMCQFVLRCYIGYYILIVVRH